MPKTVLVVDDEQNNRTLFEAILVANGYEVTLATDGKEGLEMVKNQGFDLVISDINMPKLSGLELLAEVQKTPELAEIPVIIMNAGDPDTNRELALKAGAKSFLSKPFLIAELLGKIGHVLSMVQQDT